MQYRSTRVTQKIVHRCVQDEDRWPIVDYIACGYKRAKIAQKESNELPQLWSLTPKVLLSNLKIRFGYVLVFT